MSDRDHSSMSLSNFANNETNGMNGINSLKRQTRDRLPLASIDKLRPLNGSLSLSNNQSALPSQQGPGQSQQVQGSGSPSINSTSLINNPYQSSVLKNQGAVIMGSTSLNGVGGLVPVRPPSPRNHPKFLSDHLSLSNPNNLNNQINHTPKPPPSNINNANSINSSYGHGRSPSGTQLPPNPNQSSSPLSLSQAQAQGQGQGQGQSPSPNYPDSNPNFQSFSIDDFEEVDEKMLRSSTFRSLYRLVRMCAAQPSCDRMVTVIEQNSKNLLTAHGVRLLLVQRDGFVQTGSGQPPFPLNNGLIGYVRQQREIVNLREPAADSRFDANIDAPPNLSSEGGGLVDGRSSGQNLISPQVIHSMLLVPVEADSKADCTGAKDVVAVIQAWRRKDTNNLPASSDTHMLLSSPFSTRDCKVLYRLGEFVGNMLRNSRSVDRAHAMYNASLQSHKRSAALLDVAKALASETKLDNVVSIIVSQVPELLDSDRCTLYFVDKEKEQLIVTKGASKGRAATLASWVFGQSNAPELPFPPGQNEFRFSIHQGIAGHVAMTGETLNIEDAHMDQRFNSTIDKETGYRTRSLLCVPMIDSSGEIIGVVQAMNKNPLYGRFDQQDETLLSTFSAQAALAVRNSQLFQKTETALVQSDALLEVTQALSGELKIDALIHIICSKVQQLLSSERCTVFIVDFERKELYTSDSMSYGMGPALPINHEKQKLIYFPMDRGIAGAVATSGTHVNIPDAYKDSRFNRQFDKETGFRTRSILCMAIRNHRNETVGVLQVMNKKDAVFDAADEKLLSAFCAQAAVAIENSRLFQETEKALNHALADQRNLKFMLSVTKNLFSDMHLTSMIEQMTMQVHHLLKADNCALYLVDEAGKEFYLAKDESDPNIHKWSYSTGLVGHVARTGETVRISSNAHQDPRFHPAVDQRKGKTTHSLLVCPIVAEIADQAKIVGVISVRDEKDRGGFEAEEEKLLKVFCAQAAVAIMNAKKFSSIMEQSEIKSTDFGADELRQRGMNLTQNNIENFFFKMEDIQMKQAIGTGSYGEVHKAIVKNQVVAVKKLHVRNLKAEQVDAFCQEASLMCQLKHKNIVGFIGAVTEPSNLCIITEFCARGSLADLLLEPSVPMSFYMKVKCCYEAALGMLYLHTSNPVILHRDLKSDNLLVTEDWTVKVADFGLTRFISAKKQMTQVGTPMWMAPEIIMGKNYTEKADVYAFGIIIWEIETRLEPYEDKEPMQIVVEVVNEDLRPTIPPDHLNSPLVPLMKDCWHPDPEQRPPFERIVERLKQILSTIPPDPSTATATHGHAAK